MIVPWELYLHVGMLPGYVYLELELKDMNGHLEVMKQFSLGLFLLNPRYQDAVEGAGCSTWWSWTPDLLDELTTQWWQQKQVCRCLGEAIEETISCL